MTTRIEFNCYYQGGVVLRNQTYCPLTLDGEPLLHTETNIVEDVYASSSLLWLLLLLFWAANRRK